MANAWYESVGKATENFGKTLDHIVKGKDLKGADAAINKIANFTGGVEFASRLIKDGDVKQAFAKTFKNGDDLNIGKIAGSYMGLAAGARVLSGGGLYKDRNGNTNIAGIPFV